MPNQSLRQEIKDIMEKTRYAINPCGYPIGGEAFNNCENMLLNQATDSILQAVRRRVPEKKLTYEHKEIKVGEHYVKEADARYNAGVNDTIEQMLEGIGK